VRNGHKARFRSDDETLLHVETHRCRLVVAGAGYVGLATATGFARQGHQVDLVDVNPLVVQALTQGRLHFHEPALANAFSEAALAERIRVRLGYGDLESADFAFICTPTPSMPDGALDNSTVYSAVQDLLATCSGELRIVIRSTLNPGDSDKIAEWAEAKRPNVEVLFNPEFLREGYSLEDFEAPSRVVIGGLNGPAIPALGDLYAFAGDKLIVTDRTSAELIKLGANAALAVRVSLANEVAHLASAVGADCETVLAGIGADPRIGSSYLKPGIGFGGSCLPKDLASLRTSAQRAGIETPVFDGADRTNEIALERLLGKALNLRQNGSPRRVSVIGAAFKSGSDSVRHSRAILLIQRLLSEGMNVSVFDPLAEAGTHQELGDSVTYAHSIDEAVTGTSLAIVVDRSLLPAAELADERVQLIDGLAREIARQETALEAAG
jgi:UDPglucose 6-dehydrogenase